MRALLALVWLLAPSAASADAIPLLTCPAGWRSTNAGHSAYCAPTPCTSDAECGGGTCVDVARCMRTQRMDIGDAPPSDPPATYEEPTDARCGADGSCGTGSHCAHARECTAPTASASSCAVGHAHSTGIALASALVLLALVLRRA